MALPNRMLAAMDALASASGFAAVTPTDDTNLPGGVCRGIWVGTGGDIQLVGAEGGAAVVISNVPDGTLLPFSASQIESTNTTASNIVALY